jgi:hypothetical protein
MSLTFVMQNLLEGEDSLKGSELPMLGFEMLGLLSRISFEIFPLMCVLEYTLPTIEAKNLGCSNVLCSCFFFDME